MADNPSANFLRISLYLCQPIKDFDELSELFDFFYEISLIFLIFLELLVVFRECCLAAFPYHTLKIALIQSFQPDHFIVQCLGCPDSIVVTIIDNVAKMLFHGVNFVFHRLGLDIHGTNAVFNCLESGISHVVLIVVFFEFLKCIGQFQLFDVYQHIYVIFMNFQIFLQLSDRWLDLFGHVVLVFVQSLLQILVECLQGGDVLFQLLLGLSGWPNRYVDRRIYWGRYAKLRVEVDDLGHGEQMTVVEVQCLWSTEYCTSELRKLRLY